MAEFRVSRNLRIYRPSGGTILGRSLTQIIQNSPLRLALLACYINLADTKPWAREGLRALLRELLAKGEDMPGLLVQWVLDQYARGDPAPRRGRPEESERDYHVVAGFTLLLEQKYTREAAIDKIAEVMSYEPDGIQYIIRKHENTPSVR